MSKYLIILLAGILTNCETQSTNEESTQTQEESTEITPPNKTSETCNLDDFLNDPSILTEAKEIWRGTRQPMDDDQTFKVLYKLKEASESELPFYILVVDKINKLSDGALSEMTMQISYDFINKRTEEFFSTFQPVNCLLIEQNLNYPTSFAQKYGDYLSIDCDGAPTEQEYEMCTSEQIEELKKSCKSCEMNDFVIALKGSL